MFRSRIQTLRAMRMSVPLLLYMMAATIAAVSTAILALMVIAPARRVERFGEFAAESAADSWLREGVLALGRVPSLKIPGASVATSTVRIDDVPVRDSMVWRDTLQAARDGLFVGRFDDSLADLEINENHPYAEYLIGFENKVLSLRAQGRQYAVHAFSDVSIRDLESKAFERVREDDGAKVYTLSPRFASNRRAAQAAYDLLFAVATLRSCFVHGEAVDKILEALSDFAALKRRNSAQLERTMREGRSDVKRAQVSLQKDFDRERDRMDRTLSSQNATVRDLADTDSEVRERTVLAELERAATEETVTDRNKAISRDSAAALQAENKLDDLLVRRGGVSVDLEISKDRESKLSDMLTSNRREAEAEARKYAIEAERAEKAASHYDVQARNLSRDSRKESDRLRNLRERNAANTSAVETAADKLESGRRLAERTRAEIDAARQRGMALSQEEARLKAEADRTSTLTKDITDRMDGKLRSAMDANNDAQRSYALWDRYANLARLEDEIEANNDGLPKIN